MTESIFRNSPNAIVIYEVKNEGKTADDYIIRNINPRCMQIENWLPEKVIGRPISEVRPGVAEFGIIDIFHQVWKTGEAAHYPASVYHEAQEQRWFQNNIFRLPSGEIVAIYGDITDQKRAEIELFAEKEKLRITLYSIADAVITTDRDGRVEMLNLVAEDLTGWRQQEAIGKLLSTVFDIYNEVTGLPCPNPVELVLTHGKAVELANHTALRARDGAIRAIADSAAPITDNSGDILGVVLVFRDMTEAQKRSERIEFLSLHDSLTGLYNRAYFEERLRDLDSANYLPLSIIMGDLNGLKLINDVFGHQKGDEVLISTAQLIKNSCRQQDIVARWGGDEFVVLLAKTPASQAEAIIERIRSAFKELSITDINLSISLGSATKELSTQTVAGTLKRAEDNMYRNKLLGEQSLRSAIVASIKSTLFEKSCETEEHGERLSYYCRLVGQTMGLSAAELDELEVLAMLHDVGKVAIDDHILMKPGPLTPQEWEIMRRHPEIGYRIAQAVPDLLGIAQFILAHHERWDGHGYPRGLSGNAIPLQARILAVVDAYDAMTSERPYRAPLSVAEATLELKENAGSQFDPQVVEIFLGVLETEGSQV